MLVDCDTCQVRGPGCSDCVVTVLLGMPAPAAPVDLDDAQHRALGVLAASGLVPPLRLARPAYDAGRGSGGHRAG